jgi:hypothetical protein
MITVSTPTFVLTIEDEQNAEIIKAFFGGLTRGNVEDAIKNFSNGIALATPENIEFGWNFIGEVYGQLLDKGKNAT